MPRRHCKRWGLTVLLTFATHDLAFAIHHVSFLMFLGHCIRGEMDAIRIILAENPEYAYELSTEGESCLHLASVYGHADVTRLLLHGDDDFHEPKHRKEKKNTLQPPKDYVDGEQTDTTNIDKEHGNEPKALFRSSSQRPNIVLDGIANAMMIHERLSYEENLEKKMSEPHGEKRKDEF